eukprot:scaffold12440_cov56-Isochrysis_galbana.AAC.1
MIRPLHPESDANGQLPRPRHLRRRHQPHLRHRNSQLHRRWQRQRDRSLGLKISVLVTHCVQQRVPAGRFVGHGGGGGGVGGGRNGRAQGGGGGV